MDKHSINEWLDFPIAVFIDTQVFLQESCDFSANRKLSFLAKGHL